jgi:predicted transcriptional regulator
VLILFSKKLSIEDAARLILNGHERTLVIQDEDSKLVGVLSQGDILRVIWNGISTKSSIEEFINYNPLFIDTTSEDKDQIALKLFVEEGVLVIPEIDVERRIVRIIRVRELVRHERR